MDAEKIIKIYPSNWLYNASVIGFLKSLCKVEKYDINNINKWFEGNILLLPKEIFLDLKIDDRYFNEDKSKNISSIVGKSSLYRNYINSNPSRREQDKKGFIDFVKELANLKNENGQNLCGLCSRDFALSPQSIKKLNEKWNEYSQSTKNTQDNKNKKPKIKKVPSKNGFVDFFSNLQRYNVAHNNLLAPSIFEFPNAFWNLKDSFSVCPLCAYLIIHHHIPFESTKTQDGQIFINAPSFKAMWHLNQYASKILSERNNYKLREILGISFMELAQRVSITMGALSIMNIEMVILKNKKVNYYSLPYEIARLLLNKNIASLISETKEDCILELILDGKFDSLLILNEKILRYLLSNSSDFKDEYLSKLKNKERQSLKVLSMKLPELYVKINSILKER